ncbi:hypothetical protein ACRALDRAFT_1071834 [Sodiomyces alcalophilus JCM 7366]|uniref:uncharacterized protein n=1 Tax=Sodiomyces alcalophilus JCM 7366 TaxID=591952 RepID=UPI0039B5D724
MAFQELRPYEEKKKYFKIEKAQTAPTQAAWSADNVKRRRLENQSARADRKRAELTRRHIRRSRVLGEPRLGGILGRQLGVATPSSWPFSYSSAAPSLRDDVPGAVWAAGLVDKGHVPFAPSFAAERFPNVPCFWVGGQDEKTGLGVAYACELFSLALRRGFVPFFFLLIPSQVCRVGTDADDMVSLFFPAPAEQMLSSIYIPTDENGSISYITDGFGRRERRLQHYPEPSPYHQLSSITYHGPSNRMIFTSDQPQTRPGLWLFSPRQTFNQITTLQPARRFHRPCSVHHAVPAPDSASDLVCTLGTDFGILHLDARDNLGWLTGDPISLSHEKKGSRPVPKDVLAQCFHATNPSLLLAGTRASSVHLIDRRAPPGSWSSFRHSSSVTHLRCLEGSAGSRGSHPHHVLVAGLQSSLCIYDLRYLSPPPTQTQPSQPQPPPHLPRGSNTAHPSTHRRRRRPKSGSTFLRYDSDPGTSAAQNNRNNRNSIARNDTPAQTNPTGARTNVTDADRDTGAAARPVLTFPAYRNAAHVHIGFDLDPATGVVAAAHDDGRVALYSLASGQRLRSPVVDAVCAPAPVRSLMFQAMPRDRHASLWVGIGTSLRKFSVGSQGVDDEC